MASHSLKIDRAVPPTYRYQYYDGISHASEITVDFNEDLGRAAKTGLVVNNGTGALSVYLNYSRDILGTMIPVPVDVGGTFSFTIYEMNVSEIKITSGSTVNVDIFVT